MLADILAGFLWITILFAGLIGFARTFEIEREEGALDSLLLVPIDRSGLFLAKALANLVFIVALEMLVGAVARPLLQPRHRQRMARPLARASPWEISGS